MFNNFAFSEPLPEKGDAAIVDIGVTVDDAVRTYSVYTLEAKGIAELDAEAVVFQAWSTEDMPRPLGIYHMMALRTHNTSGVEELFHKDITEEIDDFRRVFRYRVRNVTFSQLWTQAKDARLHAEKYGDFVRTFDENLRKYFTTHVPKGRTIKLKHIKCCFFTLMMIYNPLILILAFVDFVLRKLRLY